MGYNMASWKLLEEMLITLKRKGVETPINILEDLRAAKSMIKLSCMEGGEGGDAIQKAEELIGTVEAYLVTEAQKTVSSELLDQWLRRLEEANAETCEAPKKIEFVTGVPRDQKWVRVEPISSLSTERILQIAKSQNLAVNPQKDGRLVVYGETNDLKGFVKQMTLEAAKK